MPEKNHKLKIQYDGRPFKGWQLQENGPTIQGEIETILERIWGRRIVVHGSGRTDAGVHAKGQVAHFMAEKRLSRIELMRALNAQLPAEIRVNSVSYAPADFHAQYSAVDKTYQYLLESSNVRSPFTPFYVAWTSYSLELERMVEAASAFIGEHDFSAMMGSGSSVKTTVRKVTRCDVSNRGKLFRIIVTANGFLKHMVRNIAGLLIEVGRGKREPSSVARVLESGDRRTAGATAPAEGLTLLRVRYQ